MLQIIKIKNWFEMREEGQGLVEYALILALIAVVAVLALTGLGGEVKTILTGIVDSLKGS